MRKFAAGRRPSFMRRFIAIPVCALAVLSLSDMPTARAQETIAPPPAAASSSKKGGPVVPTSSQVALSFRPHCTEKDASLCIQFPAEDPLLLLSRVLSGGETFDIDVFLHNAARFPVKRVRAWLQYDPEILEGIEIEESETLPLVTPGEKDFDAENGYVKLQMESRAPMGTNVEYIAVARVQFRVRKAPEGGRTILSFYDAEGATPHTSVFTTPPLSLNVLTKPTGSLAVLVEETSHSAAEESSSSVQVSAASSGAPSPPPPAIDRTSFVLLQVQNVRVTTDGTSLYVAWDALPAPELRGYHVYYGTQMGRYLQRRTVRPEETSLAVRSLTRGTPSYVAVRGFDEDGQETAFSQEASVTIGDPRSASSPLLTIPDGESGNPLLGNVTGAVPGASGPATTSAMILLGAAAVGTLFALRRQHLATRFPPSHD